MLVYNEQDLTSNDKSTKMSTVAIDVRLRRQMPVTITAKPPRLRLGFRASSSSQQQQCKRLQKQQDINSCPINCKNAVQESQATASGASVSDHEKKWYQTNSVGNSENPRKVVSNGKGPIIHHQRQNLKNRFQLLKTLGEGTYGKVKLALDKATGEHVAIKYIKKTKIEDKNDLNRIRREIQILSSLRHKHIVNIREVFEKKDKIVLVLDYAQGGELYDYLNRMGQLAESEARRIFRQIVSAIHYCHQNDIVHRDLKLENIILDDKGNVKIADFGLANYYSHNSTLKTFCGSPLYASPEIVNGNPYHGPEVDVWSLGVILYTLVYGAMPFESNNLVSLKQQISEGDYNVPSKLSDAAGLIRHMLTVTPSRRATMEDALRHWWVNFGHTQMPNDMPYSPDDEPPTMTYNMTAETGAVSASLNSPSVIHHRNQSSISSDSDVELDFKPKRWSTRTILLDSTGNSVSSSVASSPAPTPDNYRHSEHIDDDPAAIASGLLKLPPDVLEILKGCSSKSLAALLSNDISSGFDVNITSSNSSCHTHIDKMTAENTEPDKMSSSVFDSERKPKRGILKRKGKFSGNENGCIMSEDRTVMAEDKAIPKSGHLPRRLPSFREEAHGIFVSKNRATQLLDQSSDSPYHESFSGAISHSAWCSPSSRLLPEQLHNEQHKHHVKTPENITSVQEPISQCHYEVAHIINEDITISVNNENIPSEQTSMSAKQECHQEDIIKLSSEDSACHDIPYKEPAKVIYRPKSILKKSSFDDGKNRLSISSIGSNSSADILDLSYDSADSDHFINQGADPSPDSEVSNSDVSEVNAEDIKISDQRSYSFDEGLLNLQINDSSTGLSYADRQRSLSDYIK
uniref:non-specific serine/threonine protein kinase n=1 Tax=Arion vulgaris TaxID=1028688 RepID=A0A0B6ZQP0_9EUPU